MDFSIPSRAPAPGPRFRDMFLPKLVTVLQNRNKDLKILSDTRTQHDTLEVFGGEYPGGALYTKASWIEAHPKETQALANAIVATP